MTTAAFLLAAADPLQHVLPHELFHIGGISISNQMFMALVAAILMLLIFPLLFRRPIDSAPTGAANFFESILEFLRVEVFRPALKEHTDRFVPFLWTIFFFILFCNLLGQIPISELITVLRGGHAESHLGATATGNIATTFALALLTFLWIHFSGVYQVAKSLIDGTYGHHGHHEEHSASEAAVDMEHVRGEALPADVPGDFKAVGDPTHHYADDEHIGHKHDRADDGTLHKGVDAHGHSQGQGTNPAVAVLLAIPLYLWNFAPHPFKPQPGESSIKWLMDFPLFLLLLVLEMLGAVIKPFALMMRLFANMIAGHIVLAVLVGLIPVTAGIALQIGIGIPVTVLSLLIRFLEFFVAFLQAYIFTFLATLFIASAVAPEH